MAVRRFARRAVVELRSARHARASDVVSAWRRGFYATSVEMYDFRRFGYSAYVPDLKRVTTLGRLNRYPHLLDDKFAAFLFLREMKAPTPTVHALVEDGELTPLRPLPEGRLVVKPRRGSGGTGVAVVENAEALGAACAGSQIVTDFVEQHEYAARISPTTSNSVRVLAMRDPDSGKVFVPAAAHRFGVKASSPVDNFAHGGFAAPIDVETGTVGPAAAKPVAGRPVQRVERHPETDAPIAGVTVPHWDDVLAEVSRLGELTAGFDYVGWDILVTEDGFSILEGNNRSDVNVYQINGPLLVDERVRRFLRAHR